MANDHLFDVVAPFRHTTTFESRFKKKPKNASNTMPFNHSSENILSAPVGKMKTLKTLQKNAFSSLTFTCRPKTTSKQLGGKKYSFCTGEKHSICTGGEKRSNAQHILSAGCVSMLDFGQKIFYLLRVCRNYTKEAR